jgi:RyR domain-containing protein
MSAYEPQPLDTAGIELPPSLVALTEKLAENAHDHWARERIAQGWQFGPQRDDTRKQHPCLLPYDRLPESERVFDRRTAVETLKAIMALGYRILPPSPPTP